MFVTTQNDIIQVPLMSECYIIHLCVFFLKHVLDLWPWSFNLPHKYQGTFFATDLENKDRKIFLHHRPQQPKLEAMEATLKITLTLLEDFFGGNKKKFHLHWSSDFYRDVYRRHWSESSELKYTNKAFLCVEISLLFDMKNYITVIL